MIFLASGTFWKSSAGRRITAIGRGVAERRETFAKQFKAATAFLDNQTFYGVVIIQPRGNSGASCEVIRWGRAQRLWVPERNEEIERKDALLFPSLPLYVLKCPVRKRDRSLLGTLVCSALDRRQLEQRVGCWVEKGVPVWPSWPATSHKELCQGARGSWHMSQNSLGSAAWVWIEVSPCQPLPRPLLLGCWNKGPR